MTPPIDTTEAQRLTTQLLAMSHAYAREALTRAACARQRGEPPCLERLVALAYLSGADHAREAAGHPDQSTLSMAIRVAAALTAGDDLRVMNPETGEECGPEDAP